MVMYEGDIVGILDASEATREKVGIMMAGAVEAKETVEAS